MTVIVSNSILLWFFPPFPKVFCWKRFISQHENLLSMNSSQESRRNRIIHTNFSYKGMSNRDTQRQVSNTTNRLERKMRSTGWLYTILDRYNTIQQAKSYQSIHSDGNTTQYNRQDMFHINNIMSKGIPYWNNEGYITKMYKMIESYVNSKPTNPLLHERVRYIFNKCNSTTQRYIKHDKANMYNLNTKMPHVVKVENPEYNGHRIHIKLEEVL